MKLSRLVDLKEDPRQASRKILKSDIPRNNQQSKLDGLVKMSSCFD